jgi:hypothetical protein
VQNTLPDRVTEGLHYMIDVGYTNSGEVILVRIYGQNFCRVKDPGTGEEWDTMIYRLSPIKANELSPEVSTKDMQWALQYISDNKSKGTPERNL